MNLLLCKITQSGTNDAMPEVLLNGISNNVDDALRLSCGKYYLRLADDILPDGGAGVTARGTILNGKAQSIKCSYLDVNLVLVETFDGSGNPVDLDGVAFVGVQSPTSIF